MFLKTLSIHHDHQLIREISFHKGINLIIDETKSELKTESGNGVGKTTVLRLIDYCLDGKGQNIYLDPEFKVANKKVETFLKNNNVIITLLLIEDITDTTSRTIEIKRNFLQRNKKIQTINGETYSNDNFSNKLKELIFDTTLEKPTFRQLKSKNIRDEKNKLMHTIRVLEPNVTTDATYEALHLFWFGVAVDTSKDQLIRDKNLEEKLQTRLRKEYTLSQITQSLVIINQEIETLSRQKEQFSLNENYNTDLQKLNHIKFQMNSLSTRLSRLELRRELILESKNELEKNVAHVDTEQIKRMYEKARSLVPDIQRTFEETLIFHNEMIQQKMKFITQELPELEKEIYKQRKELAVLLTEEKRISEALIKIGAIEDLQVIIRELNHYFEQKGHFEEQKNIWENSIERLKHINNRLQEINENISLKEKVIQQRIEEFNHYFSSISSRLDGVHSLLSADPINGVYKFRIVNIEGNPGTGTKKSQMASFDLAYIKFADAIGIPCLHFVLQDQIENVHSNQITNLLTEIVNEINCQYVLPVLRDKLPTDIDIKEFQILSLSQEEKLLKI